MNYYRHSTSSFDDEKIVLLYAKFGYEALGLFYTILEKLGKQEKPVSTKALKKQLNIGKRLEKCWDYIEELGLVSSTNGETFSENILKHAGKYEIKKEKNAERIKKWRENKGLEENGNALQKKCNAPQENKELGISNKELENEEKEKEASPSQNFQELEIEPEPPFAFAESPPVAAPPPPAGMYTIQECYEAYMSPAFSMAREQAGMSFYLHPDVLHEWVKAFCRDLIAEGQFYKAKNDFTKHFKNWLKLQDRTKDPTKLYEQGTTKAGQQPGGHNTGYKQRVFDKLQRGEGNGHNNAA